MKRIILISLCIALSISVCSCSGGSPAESAPAPRLSDAELEEWANRFPAQYEEWSGSVHGAAYLEGNADVPGCTDCHADPDSEEMATALYRVQIPSRCARCHADEQLMSGYELATDVYTSYKADYHGATIEYYRAKDTTSMRYEAVCSDCHASHAVYGAEDARSSVAPANLLATCQKCHVGAAANFAAASGGHFRTTADASLLVFLVKLFYLILIPVVLGGMLAYIGLDIVHRATKKARGRQS